MTEQDEYTADDAEHDEAVAAAQERDEDPDGDHSADDPGTVAIAPRTEPNEDLHDPLADVPDDGDPDDEEDLDDNDES